MLVSDITRLAQRRIGDDDFYIVTQQDVYDWINEAQMKIVREVGALTGTSSLAANTYPVVLPNDYIDTKRVTYGTTQLSKIEIEDLDALNADTTTQDSPYYYYIFDGKLQLYPDPAASDTTTITHYYSRAAATISSPGATPEVPVSFHYDIANFVVARCRERLQDHASYGEAMQEFNNELGTRTEDGTVRDDSYPIIRDDAWDVTSDLWGK